MAMGSIWPKSQSSGLWYCVMMW